MVRSLKRPEVLPNNPYHTQPLPTGRPIAVYYRQSSEGQIGNVSTTLQKVDMVEHLERLGWPNERIRLIDIDAGISGTKKMKDRPGMSQLLDMIKKGQVGAVAAQDVDRFFRDLTQIESNTFLDECKQKNVLVLTPTMVYDFCHPTLGDSHIAQFRIEAQRAADYLLYQIKGRLVKARHYRSERGFWAGRKIAPGFMIDMRVKLPDGSPNPNLRKYVKFEPWAAVVVKYFEMFRANDGNLDKTWRQIEREGPGFPPVTDDMIPTGFKWHTHLDHYSPITGQLVPAASGVEYLLTNVAYIGHWIHKQVIVQWDNHEPIVPHELFMYAFNRISQTDFNGDPNPNFVRYRPWTRHDKAERQVEPPTYERLVFSHDLPDKPKRRLSCVWNTWRSCYQYQLANMPYKSNVWNMKASILDEVIDHLLLERLKATTIDDKAWQEASSNINQGSQSEVRRIEQGIKSAKQKKDTLIANLASLSNPEMVKRTEAFYEAADAEITILQAELIRVTASRRQKTSLTQARPVLTRIIEHWENVPRQERHELFEGFGDYINLSKLNMATKRVTIYWRDQTTSTYDIMRTSRGFFWDDEELEQLREMIDNNVDQVDILRAFPKYNWRALQERYAYNFGNGYWSKTYNGKRPYNRGTSWADTAEYREEQAMPQSTANASSFDRYI
jgi:DNA invertase Pin-like site-specific DNA recombinase